MLKCKDVSTETSNYIDGELPFLRRLFMRLHLLICPNCRRYVEQVKHTIETVQFSEPKEVDTADQHALAKQLQALAKRSDSETP